jgi:hypothetical protein
MLKPAGERVLACHRASKRVNNSRADGNDATLIEKVDLESNANADKKMPPNKDKAKNTN